jgi:hypothetical protein
MSGTEDANRSEAYKHASWSLSHDLHHHLHPGGLSPLYSHEEFMRQEALAPHQEAMHQEALLVGYRIPPPNVQSFSTAQLPPPAMPVGGGGGGGAYFPPTGGAQHALIAEFRAFQKAEAAKALKESQTKEASMYEQLGRATAAATAISFQGTFSSTGGSLLGMEADYRVAQQVEAARTLLREKQSREFLMYAQLEQAKAAAAATSFRGAAAGRSHGVPFQYQGMPRVPPWAMLPSAANANMTPSVTPESSVAGPYSGRTNSHTSGIAAAPHQSPPQYQPSPPGGPLRHPQKPARTDAATAGERVRQPVTKVKKPPKKKLCRYYLKSSKARNYSAERRSVPNKTDSADM